MKNVLHLCESSDTGGAESVLISLVEGLDKSRYRSVVCLLSEGWLSEQLRSRDIETLIIPQPRSFDAGWLYRLYRLLKARKIDIMHSHEFATNVYASLLSTVTGVPVVATAHGKNYYADKWRRRAAYRFVSRQSTLVAVSHDLGRFLESSVGISASRIRMVHNGIDTSRFRTDGARQSTRDELGVDDTCVLVGTVGNLFPVKGQAFLIQACATLAKEHTNFLLIIAGDGELLHPLKAEASKLGIAEKVKFLGFRSDVPALLQAMDIFVLPSLSEGLPLSVLEALALQKAVVASDVGGIGEIIDTGENGFLVPPGNPVALAQRIAKLLAEPKLAMTMGAKGRQTVEREFSVEKMVREYEGLYEELT